MSVHTVIAARLPATTPALKRVELCGSCTALCCKNDLIVLHPELGDDVASYEAEAITHPLTGKPGWALTHKANGDCIYLGDSGCTIHGRHPAICREYDCGDQFAKMDRVMRRRFIKAGAFSKAQLQQGRRVHEARQALA